VGTKGQPEGSAVKGKTGKPWVAGTDRKTWNAAGHHALFPVPTFGAYLAAGFPTLFSTASGVIGLVAGPSSALRSLNY
jgi:hypothetical protein